MKSFVLVAAAVACMMGSTTAADAQSKTKLATPAKAPTIAAASAAPVDGKKVFATICLACHQLNGEGLEEKYPPLAGSELVADDDGKIVRIILHGVTGPVEVQGQTFEGLMPPWGPTLKDAEIAAVATYVRRAWGNKAASVTTARVTIRASSAAVHGVLRAFVAARMAVTLAVVTDAALLPHARRT